MDISRISGVPDRLQLLPNVDSVVAVVVPIHLDMMQTGRPADFLQHLRLDLFRVVRCRHGLIFGRGGLIDVCHYFFRHLKVMSY